MLVCSVDKRDPAVVSFYNKTYQEWWIISLKPMSGLSGQKNSRVVKPPVGYAVRQITSGFQGSDYSLLVGFISIPHLRND